MQVQKNIVLNQSDYKTLEKCKNLINELYDAVVKHGAIIPPTETALWHLLNKIDVINEQHAILLAQKND